MFSPRPSLLLCLFILGACSTRGEISPPVFDPKAMFVEGEVDAEEGGFSRTYSYRLLKPVNSRDQTPRPLLVFLHGIGERGSDNLDQLDYLPTWMVTPEWRDRFSAFILALQCPDDELWVRSWDEGGASRALLAVENAIEQVTEDENIDPSRIYLTGLSMGGYGAWALAVHRPDLFAGLVPICGGGDPATVERLRGLPIWVFHGSDDLVVRESESLEMVASLRAHGIPVGYTRLEGVAHDSWTDAYLNEGAVNWLFSQKRP